jgi:hypothetical protein
MITMGFGGQRVRLFVFICIISSPDPLSHLLGRL